MKRDIVLELLHKRSHLKVLRKSPEHASFHESIDEAIKKIEEKIKKIERQSLTKTQRDKKK